MSFFISNAYAQAGAPAPAGGGIEFMIMIAIFFALMYFMIIRPQSKRAKEHRKLLEALSKGDEVVTTGGMVGKISAVGENFLEVEVSEGTVVKVQKQAVTAVLPKGTIKGL
jgi:preprotein translocase subunit YajC